MSGEVAVFVPSPTVKIVNFDKLLIHDEKAKKLNDRMWGNCLRFRG
jgi:hypothetical protein